MSIKHVLCLADAGYHDWPNEGSRRMNCQKQQEKNRKKLCNNACIIKKSMSSCTPQPAEIMLILLLWLVKGIYFTAATNQVFKEQFLF
jgi:hypothetical protein